MAFDYSGLNASTADLISAFGRTMVLRSRSAAPYDPATSSVAVTTTDYSVRAVFPATRRNRRGGESAAEEGKTVLVAAKGLPAKPVERDQIIDGGDTYQVLEVEEVKPGDTALLYVVKVRK